MNELVVIAGDDIGREVIPSAVQCLHALLPLLRLHDAEAGYDHAWRTGAAIAPAVVAEVRRVGSALVGPERPPADGRLGAIATLCRALDLYAALFPLPLPNHERQPLLLLQQDARPDSEQEHRALPPLAAWEATRLGNLANRFALDGWARIAVAHDSEGDFAHAVAGGISDGSAVERLDAIFLVNQFPALLNDFDLIVASAGTGRLLLRTVARELLPLTQVGALLIGDSGQVATPAHGSLRAQVGWGFANPLGAMRAVVALLRHGWGNERAAQQLEQAIKAGLARRRPPELGGLHSLPEVTRAIVQAVRAQPRA